MKFERMAHSSGRKVVIYAEAFLPNVGGAENYSFDLAQTLTDLGEDVTIVTPIRSLTEDAFSFKVIRMERSIFFGFNVNFLEPLLDIIGERPNVVLLSGPAISDFLMIPLLRILRFPMIVIFHGQFNKAWARKLMKVVIPVAYRFVDKIVVETSRDLNYLKDLNVPAGRIEFLFFDGVNREKFKCQPEKEGYNYPDSGRPLRFIFVGGLTSSRPYKGIDLLVEIFMKIGESNISPTPELFVVGSGDLLQTLRDKARDFTNIHFLGHLNDDELIRELCLSDVLILPSKTDSEGLGKVVFEAVSCGKPVMVSKFAGSAELIKKYDAGIIFDPFDIEGIMNTIRMLNSNSIMLKKLSLNGQRMMAEEGLDLLNTAERHMKLYESVIALSRHR
ncbi:MAG: glycosyltransferase family 4 protein [Thermoplasmata archaeon]